MNSPGPDSETAARARRKRVYPLHLLLRPLGYLEFTDVYTFDLRPDLSEVRLKPGYTIVHASAADIDEIVANLPRDEPPGVLRTLFAEGHHCFAAKFDGRVVAYNWIFEKEY